ANNGFEQNTLSHTRGVVSMARNSFNMDSASSQFFICYTDNYTSSLDGNYAAFGKVIDGMETVDDFLKVQMLPNGNEVSKPATPIVIKSAVVVE
ncbi:MAG: peptidylprolyl isomerase, partial [Clostridia bacterium]|nr:peptidylprolyl isomerase [Clostridia bacterium]